MENMEILTGLFDKKDIYLRKLNKASYEANMKSFEEEYGPAMDALMAVGAEGQDAAGAYESVAVDFSRKVYEKFEKKGKIGSILLMDLNFMMIYYVFPYLLKNKDRGGEELASVLKGRWNETFGSNISYTTYEEIYNGFKKKLFGFF